MNIVVTSRIQWSTLLPDGWTRDSQHTRGSWFSGCICKKASGQGVRTHPPMILLAMVRERYLKQLVFYWVSRGYQGDPFLLRVKAYIYSFRGTAPFINGEEIFYVVMMIIGVSRSTIILRMAVRDHGRWCGCQRLWEAIM